MSANRAYSLWPQQWDTLAAALGEGADPHGIRSPGGKLDGVKYVSRAEWPDVPADLLPAIGCAFSGIPTFSIPLQGTREVTPIFVINVVDVVPFDRKATPDTSGVAMSALRKYVNDLSGNGVEPILASLGTMGGFAIRSMITGLDYGIADELGEQSLSVVFARFVFSTVDRVRPSF